MSGGVCEPRHENGTTVHRAVVCHLFLCVKLGDSATTTHGKLQQTLGDDAMSREQESLAEPLLKVSSAEDNHQQHGPVTTHHG